MRNLLGVALTQSEKGRAFRALHEGDPFVIPNPWDAGSAKILAGLGFKALASTSSGFAFTLGRADGQASREEVLEHARVLDAATDLPVAMDLENGYGPAPEDAARTIASAAAAGAVGGSIEDYDPDTGLYPLELVDPLLAVVVLDRATDRPRLGGARDRQRRVLGPRPVAVLEVHRDRQAGRPVEEPDVRDHLVQGHLAVEAPEREGKSGAGSGQGRKAERLQDPCRAGVPGIRDHERLALVQGAEVSRLLILGRLLAYLGRPPHLTPWLLKGAIALSLAAAFGRQGEVGSPPWESSRRAGRSG